MKNKVGSTVILLMFAFVSGSCQPSCDLIGDWHLAGTRTAQGGIYKHDRASFSRDSITLASGFYYPVMDQNNFDDWRTGRYPFVYYGNKEKYKVLGDSLYLYSTPYNEWEAFKIKCTESGRLRLIGKSKEWALERQESGTKPVRNPLRHITAHVYEFDDIGNYAINYRVTYSKDDKLIYQQLSDKDRDHAVKTFQLNPGTFAEICQGFDYLDVSQISRNYKANFSDPEIIELELGLEDGRVIKSRIEAPEYPENLKLALIPLLYQHQRIVYPHLKPIN